MDSRKYQQLMYDLLGNRDYDNFENNELHNLKRKIGYAFYGQPQNEDGYDTKKNEIIDFLFDIILTQSNKFSKHKNRIVISFIYNCTEPLDYVKKNHSAKLPDYNPKNYVMPYPVFILRKCKYSPTSCRIIIDHLGRVYGSWTKYLLRNSLPKCLMVFPKNGRYAGNSDGQVILENQLSPACRIYAKILAGTDVASTGIGLAATGVTVAASIPAVTAVGPLALCGAGIAGIGVGVYSIGRSLGTLYDKKKHKESLSFSDTVARGAYINIIAGATGFIGAGANAALSQLTSRGMYVGQQASMLVTTISAAKLGTSGLAILNSGYEVFEPWVNDKRPSSLLPLVQLSSSILFFGHAVYNFKSASTIIQEMQSKVLEDIQESLKNGQYRKTFEKLRLATVRRNNGQIQKGNAEMIATMRKIIDADQVSEFFSKANPDLEELGIKCGANNGGITFNGVPVDLGEVYGFSKRKIGNFLSLSSYTENITPSNISEIKNDIKTTFNFFKLDNAVVSKISNYLVGLITGSVTTIAGDMLSFMKDFVCDYIINDENMSNIIDELFPNSEEKCLHIINSVIGFIFNKAKKIDELFILSNESTEPSIFDSLFIYVKEQNFSENERLKLFMKFVCDTYKDDGKLSNENMHELRSYFANFLTEQAFLFQEKKERINNRQKFRRKVERLKCSQCFGLYYSVIDDF